VGALHRRRPANPFPEWRVAATGTPPRESRKLRLRSPPQFQPVNGIQHSAVRKRTLRHPGNRLEDWRYSARGFGELSECHVRSGSGITGVAGEQRPPNPGCLQSMNADKTAIYGLIRGICQPALGPTGPGLFAQQSAWKYLIKHEPHTNIPDSRENSP